MISSLHYSEHLKQAVADEAFPCVSLLDMHCLRKSTDGLSLREQQVLSWLPTGLSNKEIAHLLCISTHTVKFHLKALFRKLEVRTRAHAVAVGTARGLVIEPMHTSQSAMRFCIS